MCARISFILIILTILSSKKKIMRKNVFQEENKNLCFFLHHLIYSQKTWEKKRLYPISYICIKILINEINRHGGQFVRKIKMKLDSWLDKFSENSSVYYFRWTQIQIQILLTAFGAISCPIRIKRLFAEIFAQSNSHPKWATLNSAKKFCFAWLLSPLLPFQNRITTRTRELPITVNHR